MALYVTRPRRDKVRIGRGLPSASVALNHKKKFEWEIRGLQFCPGKKITMYFEHGIIFALHLKLISLYIYLLFQVHVKRQNKINHKYVYPVEINQTSKLL